MNRRVYVYIDGFNLHFGAVKNTKYKWLDLVALSERLMSGYNVLKVIYCTSKSLPLDDPQSPKRQKVYWQALKVLYGNRINIIKGFHRMDPKRLRIAMQRKGKYYAAEESVMVMKIEEKGSDVNLATHLVNDAWKNLFDVALVISNDSDLAEAIRIVKIERNKSIVLANPFIGSRKNTANKLMSLELEKRKIKASQLALCQLPDPIPGTNICKPYKW